ncbi:MULTISPECIES: carboxymuconolactone decarboxylase family protein [Pseudomonadaceae]|uniref:Carboxymuconolactone decarboxylase n=1 Tax=Pseudomonas fragi TaxID=296 RepID=A0A449IFU5_PSEFR|nr:MULTISPECIES: carboxymuconolactone decarboxylase family protein [Pseudomonadaceae]VFB18321.1 carboxymuconolactone decarboxylase [Pseudomonas fragi]
MKSFVLNSGVYREFRPLAALLALCLGLGEAPSAVAQDANTSRATNGAPSPAESLSAKQKAIPLIAAYMATSDMPNLNAALNQGLDAGMTVSEAKEILVQLYAYAGFPRSLNALGELMKVLEARKQRGIQDLPGREPSQTIPTGQALIEAGTANQTRISGGVVKGPVFEFAPIINQYLQAHLFGDIFERDNLDWQSRELATVGALAATPGAEAQLRSHMMASMRVGLSVAQLRQVTEVLAGSGDEAVGSRATTALTQAIAAMGGEA